MKRKKKKSRIEQYSVIFTSETDARKKSAAFTLKRRTIIAVSAFLIVTVLACCAVVAVSLYNVSDYLLRTQNLKDEIDSQANAISSYEYELDFLKDCLEK